MIPASPIFRTAAPRIACALLAGFALLAVPAAAQAADHNLFWAPPNVTEGGRKIDGILNFIFWLTLVVFVAVQAVFTWYLIKYRRRPGVKAHYSHGNNALELVWTSIPALIFLALAIYSNHVWFEIHRDPPPDAIQVNISSFQFGWEMRYPGPDGALGRVEVAKISGNNKFGLTADDETAQDDFATTELVIPVGKPVHIILNSRDVIHSFYVPAFRLYQDAVPGRTISWVWFKVEQTGNFELACSQLCGIGHFNMKAPIRVVSVEEYDKWYAGKVKAAAEAGTTLAPAEAPAETPPAPAAHHE